MWYYRQSCLIIFCFTSVTKNWNDFIIFWSRKTCPIYEHNPTSNIALSIGIFVGIMARYTSTIVTISLNKIGCLIPTSVCSVNLKHIDTKFKSHKIISEFLEILTSDYGENAVTKSAVFKW